MRKYIYTYRRKWFGFSFYTILICIFFLANACRTSRTETASDRILLHEDTSEITGWQLVAGTNPQDENYKMQKKNGSWMLAFGGNAFAAPDTAYLGRSFRLMAKMQATKELRISKEGWDSLGVAENQSRLIIYKDGKVQQEIFLGNMFFSENNKAAYYVRLKNENKIYVIENYLDGSLKAPLNKIRRKEMVPLTPLQISDIMFLKPEGLVFSLKRAGKLAWSINGYLTIDSISQKYVAQLCSIQATDFVKAPANGAGLSIEISAYDLPPVSLRFFLKDSDTWIVSSSANPGNFMTLTQQQVNALFADKTFFMQGASK